MIEQTTVLWHKFRKRGRFYGLLLSALILSGCATTGGNTSQKDPFEAMNRQFFKMNTDIDEGVVQPLTHVYVAVTPDLMRQGISNFSSNIADAYSFANNVLQLKPTNAGQDFIRVAFNTAFGFGGLMDITSSLGIEKQNQDLGLTLARWGVPPGPYLVLPLLGPSTVRDSVDRVALLYLWPAQYIFTDWRARTAFTYLSLLEFRAQLMDAESAVDSAMIDRYQQVRDAFLQRRAYLVSGGQISYDDEDDEDMPAAEQKTAVAPAEPQVAATPEKGAAAEVIAAVEDEAEVDAPEPEMVPTSSTPSRENVLSIPPETFMISF